MCIGIALVFWLLIKLSNRFTSSMEVHLNYNIPPGKVLVQQPPSSVMVKYEGQGWDLMANTWSRKENSIVVNLMDTELQNMTVTQLTNGIKEKLITERINIIDLIDYSIHPIQLEEAYKQTVPIDFVFDIGFMGTYSYYRDSIKLSPDSVMITGPQTQVEEFTSWKTQKLVLEGIKDTVKKSMSLLPPKSPNIRINPELVDIMLPVEPFTSKSLWIPIIVKNAPDSLQIFPSRVNLSCTVGMSNFSKVRYEEFVVEVDLKGFALNDNRNTLPVNLTKQPAYIRNPQIVPKSVEFMIQQDTLVAEK